MVDYLVAYRLRLTITSYGQKARAVKHVTHWVRRRFGSRGYLGLLASHLLIHTHPFLDSL